MREFFDKVKTKLADALYVVWHSFKDDGLENSGWIVLGFALGYITKWIF